VQRNSFFCIYSPCIVSNIFPSLRRQQNNSFQEEASSAPEQLQTAAHAEWERGLLAETASGSVLADGCARPALAPASTASSSVEYSASYSQPPIAAAAVDAAALQDQVRGPVVPAASFAVKIGLCTELQGTDYSPT